MDGRMGVTEFESGGGALVGGTDTLCTFGTPQGYLAISFERS